MPKRLIICSDGTWSKPDQSAPTNVVKLSRAIQAVDGVGIEQRVFYHDGVGASGGWWKRFTGGAFGEGIDAIIQANYRFLIANFDPDDELFLFGFSRGAYLARSTVGLIRNCGLLKRDHMDQFDAAYALYRRRDDASHPRADEATAFRAAFSWEPRIKFIGVWDTVGSLGIPLMPLRFWTKEFYEFHDVQLSSWVVGVLQDSMTFWYRLLGENIRKISLNSDGQFIAPSVKARQQGTADYRPPNVPWPVQ